MLNFSTNNFKNTFFHHCRPRKLVNVVETGKDASQLGLDPCTIAEVGDYIVADHYFG